VAAVKRTAPPVVEGWAVAATHKDAPEETATAVPLPTSAPLAPGSSDPLKPTPVKTVAVQPGTSRPAALSPLPPGSRSLTPAPSQGSGPTITTIATVKSEPPKELPSSEALASGRDKGVQVASAGAAIPVPDAGPDQTSKARGGWMIQVGAFDTRTEALERINTVKDSAKDLLGQANPFTERVEKGDKALYRARFAGLEKSQAESVCKNLKRNDIPCMMLRN